MGFWSKIFGLSSGKKCSCDSSLGKSPQELWEQAQITQEDKKILKNLDPQILVGEVLSVEPHPSPKMTKVRVAQVSVGKDPLTILCGGVNLEKGQIVPVATVGAALSPDFQIGERDIRGVTSYGMICARSELGLSPADEKKGEIWILPSGFSCFLGNALSSLN